MSIRAVPASTAAIAEAAALIQGGRLVVFPTETVYGLGADAGSDRAVAAIFAAKGRPHFNPLIVHVADLAAAREIVHIDARAEALAARFWPGPLTLVLPRRAGATVSRLVSAGLDTVAVRVPSHPLAQALLKAAGRPIAAPSANPSGQLSPTRAEHVAASELGARVAMILDGGPCDVGIESTVVDLSTAGVAILRPGGVTVEAIAAALGPLAAGADAPGGGPFRSPGMLSRHYAPSRPLRLAAAGTHPGEVLLGFGPEAPADTVLNLSPSGDLEEAAANLFAMLHALDKPGVAAIAVMPVPETGLGRAINDRLRRAAAAPDDDRDDERGPAAPCVLPGLDDDSA